MTFWSCLNQRLNNDLKASLKPCLHRISITPGPLSFRSDPTKSVFSAAHSQKIDRGGDGGESRCVVRGSSSRGASVSEQTAHVRALLCEPTSAGVPVSEEVSGTTETQR